MPSAYSSFSQTAQDITPTFSMVKRILLAITAAAAVVADPASDAAAACAGLNLTQQLTLMRGFGSINGYSRNSGCAGVCGRATFRSVVARTRATLCETPLTTRAAMMTNPTVGGTTAPRASEMVHALALRRSGPPRWPWLRLSTRPSLRTGALRWARSSGERVSPPSAPYAFSCIGARYDCLVVAVS